MPQDLDQIAAAASEDIEIASVRIALQNLLNRKREALHAAAHVGVTGRNPHAYARRNRDHRVGPSVNAATAAFSVAASTAPVIRIRVPAANSISIAPSQAGPIGSDVANGSAITFAGTKSNCDLASFCSVRNSRRQLRSSEREMPYRRAVADPCRGRWRLSSTILSFSSSDQRRRRPVSTTSSRLT